MFFLVIFFALFPSQLGTSNQKKNLLKFVAKLCLWPKWQIAKLIVHIFFVACKRIERIAAHALHVLPLPARTRYPLIES